MKLVPSIDRDTVSTIFQIHRALIGLLGERIDLASDKQLNRISVVTPRNINGGISVFRSAKSNGGEFHSPKELN